MKNFLGNFQATHFANEETEAKGVEQLAYGHTASHLLAGLQAWTSDSAFSPSHMSHLPEDAL